MAKRKFYAVVRGGQPGIYDEWFGPNGAEVQIKGIANAVYKGFASLEDAETWYREIAGTSPRRMFAAREQPASTSRAANTAAALRAGKAVIYTDGGSIGNPGPGGYGAVLLDNDRRQELSGGFALTTNNRMELMAAIAALEALSGRRSVLLYSDSSYMINGIQKGWAKRWRAQGWKRQEAGALKDVKNADLWGRLLALCEQHDVELVQVPGHSGIAENERCDQLAQQAARRPQLPADNGFEPESMER